MSQDRPIQLRDMALAIVTAAVSLPVGEGKVERLLGDRLIITLKPLTEKINTLTVWNDMDQVLCVGWSAGDAPRVFCYETGEWERSLERIRPSARSQG